MAGELREAPADRPVAVALHHPIYSADIYHGGSARTGAMLDAATAAAQRGPDVVFTGHVHNTRTVGGRAVPYVIAGAGGY